MDLMTSTWIDYCLKHKHEEWTTCHADLINFQGFLNVELKGVKTVVVDLSFSGILVRVSITAIGDTIAVIKNGEVAEKGRHEVLMKITVGVYASLVAFHSSASYLLL
ncbi:ABC transporter family protein, putative [Medicago truncatula]|uniref:ABC transporter family protein, putative n=1 Tax=Medicago truncatula TaxID=3880 RepID=G7JBG5_MEDTR|nr:ABC transporter family protein, putative [Medicago truncatula]